MYVQLLRRGKARQLRLRMYVYTECVLSYSRTLLSTPTSLQLISTARQAEKMIRENAVQVVPVADNMYSK